MQRKILSRKIKRVYCAEALEALPVSIERADPVCKTVRPSSM